MTTMINYTINHPLTFVTYTDGTGNWIYGALLTTSVCEASDKLWGSDFNSATTTLLFDTKFTGKTIYDPCPLGWCVPPQDTWTNFTTTISESATIILQKMPLFTTLQQRIRRIGVLCLKMVLRVLRFSAAVFIYPELQEH